MRVSVYVTLYNVCMLMTQLVRCKVFWTLDTYPATFGQNIRLTCDTGDTFIDSKDCPVRQWSGGPQHKGLVYNGYSSDNHKYEEYLNSQPNKFSLIIKNLTESDVDANYTCACGFNTFTKTLMLEENLFYYPPTGIDALFTVANRKLRIRLEIDKVYPLPNCSLLIGARRKDNSLISRTIENTYNRHVIYSVKYLYETDYTFEHVDCDKLPMINCSFGEVAEPMVVKGNGSYKCSGDKGKIKVSGNMPFDFGNDVQTKEAASVTVEIILIVCAFLAILIFIIVLFLNRQSIRRRCSSNHQESSENGTTDTLVHGADIALNILQT